MPGAEHVSEGLCEALLAGLAAAQHYSLGLDLTLQTMPLRSQGARCGDDIAKLVASILRGDAIQAHAHCCQIRFLL